MKKIANDICRCLDSTCSEKENCLRWIERETGGERTPYCPSMRPYDRPIDEPCNLRIPLQEATK